MVDFVQLLTQHGPAQCQQRNIVVVKYRPLPVQLPCSLPDAS